MAKEGVRGWLVGALALVPTTPNPSSPEEGCYLLQGQPRSARHPHHEKGYQDGQLLVNVSVKGLEPEQKKYFKTQQRESHGGNTKAQRGVVVV